MLLKARGFHNYGTLCITSCIMLNIIQSMTMCNRVNKPRGIGVNGLAMHGLPESRPENIGLHQKEKTLAIKTNQLLLHRVRKKKGATLFLPATLRNANQFSKFFHLHTLQ